MQCYSHVPSYQHESQGSAALGMPAAFGCFQDASCIGNCLLGKDITPCVIRNRDRQTDRVGRKDISQDRVSKQDVKGTERHRESQECLLDDVSRRESRKHASPA